MSTGRLVVKRGQAWEESLQATHDAYRQLGHANIIKLPVPTAPAPGRYSSILSSVRDIGKKVFGQLRILCEKQGFDFIGTLGPNAGSNDALHAYHGRSIVMEAKYSSSRQTSLRIIPKNKTGFGIKEHQLAALAEAYSEFGAVSLIVWRNESARLVAMPDVILGAWKKFRAGGRKSIKVDEFTSFQVVDIPGRRDAEDYLFEVRKWLQANGAPSPITSSRKVYDMINYTYNPETRELVVGDVRIELAQPANRAILDHLAVEADSEAQFIEMVKNLRRADEVSA